MVKKIIEKVNTNQSKITKFLIISNVTLFSAYLFFVVATTVEVVSRKNTEEGVRTLQSSRASLEEVYNESAKAYSKDYARSLGFVEAVPTFYTTESVTTVDYDG